MARRAGGEVEETGFLSLLNGLDRGASLEVRKVIRQEQILTGATVGEIPSGLGVLCPGSDWDILLLLPKSISVKLVNQLIE